MKYPVLALAVVFLCAAVAMGADTAAIDAVRAKTAFTEADGAVINQFVGAITQEILVRTDFGNVSQTRDALVLRMDATTPSARYTELLVSAVEEHIGRGLAQADKFTDAERKRNAKVNLLMMLDKVAQVTTAQMAASQLANADASVRYWAAKCVVNPAVLSRLNSAGQGNTAAAKDIASRLKAIVPTETNPNILDLAVDFGAGVNSADATELLVAIAGRRISDYEKWTVQYELLDGKLLNALCPKAKTNKAVTSALGQLLSHCIQKYMKYMASPAHSPLMGEQQAGYLATAITVVEKGCLGDIRSGSTAMQTAIGKGSMGASALMGEYTLLFGGSGNTGELAKAFGAKYVDATGKEQDMPRPLPDKPGTVNK
jgi:hypothetical protein